MLGGSSYKFLISSSYTIHFPNDSHVAIKSLKNTTSTNKNSAYSSTWDRFFLSGGRLKSDATKNLNKINQIAMNKPWKIYFRFPSFFILIFPETSY